MHDEWLKLQKIIIGYLIASGSIENLKRARAYLCNEYFMDKLNHLWKWLIAYQDRHHGVLSLDIFRNIARAKKINETIILEFEEVIDECESLASTITDGEFSYYLERLSEVYKEISLGNILSEGTQKLFSKGYDVSKNYVLTEVTGLDKFSFSYESEIEVSDGVDAFIESVAQAKACHVQAIKFGLPSLDNTVLGLRRGDFCLIAAFATVGKTSFCVNTAVEVAFQQGKNVLYVTTETVSDTLRRRIFSRISKLSLFDHSVSSQHMKSGELNEDDRDSLVKISEYLKNGVHGRLMILQAPPDATIPWLRGKLLNYEANNPVDLVIIDELRYFRGTKNRKAEWEDFNDIIKDTKALARTHVGKGVPVIVPYQISRKGQENYRISDNKRYELSALSSSAEAERTPDLIVTIVPDEDDFSSLRFHVLKQRDGSKGREIRVKAEFDYQYFWEVSGGDFGAVL